MAGGDGFRVASTITSDKVRKGAATTSCKIFATHRGAVSESSSTPIRSGRSKAGDSMSSADPRSGLPAERGSESRVGFQAKEGHSAYDKDG